MRTNCFVQQALSRKGRRLLATLSDETKTRILTGPGLEDFVSSNVGLADAPAVPDHLKRRKGQRLGGWVGLFVTSSWHLVFC